MKKILLAVILTMVAVVPAAAGNTDSYIQKIDKLWDDAYAQIYATQLDRKTLCMMKENLDLCTEALEKDPENYEYLWRYSRAAAQYCETAQAIRDAVPEWKEICRQWGLDGFEKADTACRMNPDRPEAFFWRSYCMGKYVLVGGVGSMITAIKEGFLPKGEENVIKGYEADKAYLDYVTTFARFNYLAQVPGVPFLVKGTKKSRLEEALVYYNEAMQGFRDKQAYVLDGAEYLDNYKSLFEWDCRCPYCAEFLLMVVDKLDLEQKQRQQYLADAKAWCELGLTSPRPYYADWSRKLLENPQNW